MNTSFFSVLPEVETPVEKVLSLKGLGRSTQREERVYPTGKKTLGDSYDTKCHIYTYTGETCVYEIRGRYKADGLTRPRTGSNQAEELAYPLGRFMSQN